MILEMEMDVAEEVTVTTVCSESVGIICDQHDSKRQKSKHSAVTFAVCRFVAIRGRRTDILVSYGAITNCLKKRKDSIPG